MSITKDSKIYCGECGGYLKLKEIDNPSAYVLRCDHGYVMFYHNANKHNFFEVKICSYTEFFNIISVYTSFNDHNNAIMQERNFDMKLKYIKNFDFIKFFSLSFKQRKLFINKILLLL